MPGIAIIIIIGWTAGEKLPLPGIATITFIDGIASVASNKYVLVIVSHDRHFVKFVYRFHQVLGIVRCGQYFRNLALPSRGCVRCRVRGLYVLNVQYK